MVTRDIRTSTPITACDVCGRTLLRGERAHGYLDGGQRRSVCELCTDRAQQEGWIREGSEPPYDPSRDGSNRGRSLFGRLRGRRPERAEPEEEQPLPRERPVRERPARGRRRRAREPEPEPVEDYGYDEEYFTPAPPPPPQRVREPVREPRHVRAIPASPEHKLAAAIEVFNGSEHRRTVAGVARSLGMPTVAVLTVPDRPGQVAITVSWELCWYRYEVDLSEDVPAVHRTGQGYELDELPDAEKHPVAAADETGALALPR